MGRCFESGVRVNNVTVTVGLLEMDIVSRSFVSDFCDSAEPAAVAVAADSRAGVTVMTT